MRWRDLVSGKQREENSAKSKRRAKARKMGKGVSMAATRLLLQQPWPRPWHLVDEQGTHGATGNERWGDRWTGWPSR